MGKCWLELRYDYGARDLPLAIVTNARILRVIKDYLLAEQQMRVDKARELDEVLAVSEEMELKRLRGVLDLAIPDGDGDGQG